MLSVGWQITGRLLLSAELRTRRSIEKGNCEDWQSNGWSIRRSGRDHDDSESHDDGGCDIVHRIGDSVMDGDRDDEEINNQHSSERSCIARLSMTAGQRERERVK